MSQGESTDEQLVARFTRGETSAFETLYERYELRVFRYLLRNLGDRARPAAALQEVWLVIARDASRFQPVGRFSAWMFRIAHNRMVDAMRTARREVSLELVGAQPDWVDPACPPGADPHAITV